MYQLRVASSVYWNSVVDGLYIQDVWMGLIKPFFLGFAIVSIGCHVGLRTTGGTQGVGRATTSAVVAGSGGGAGRRLLRDQAPDRADVPDGDAPSDRLTRRARRVEEVLSGPNAPVVVFDKVSLAFDDRVILKDVSFTLLKGHTKIILGASGAGKSTILKLILGLLRPDAGVIWVNGQRVDQMNELRDDERARTTSAWCSRRARCSTR